VIAQGKLVKAMRDGGVRVVAGTDYGLPGFSLLRELEIYVDGGLTPMEAIQSATTVPADVMGLTADVGTIAVGKRADLLILDRNPLDDIHNIRSGRWVVANGRIYECAALRRSVGWRN
jgi:imidazolonepropionase-like amidohydrolase